MARSGLYRCLVAIVILTLCFYSGVLLTSLGFLKWPEAALIMGALGVLILAFLWSVGEVKRLNRE
ncbi:MAG: hypothetical protein IT158_10365 [Bryobacterales bacterium]|nr:hypothetical protein [Bryobacterales bacterium]